MDAMSTLAILDSGADHTTIPISLARNLPFDIENYPTTEHHVVLMYGNGETLTATHMMRMGDFVVHIVPNQADQALVSSSEIVDAHHTILLGRFKVLIEHETKVYSLTFPREVLRPAESGRRAMWMVPISIMNEITKLRRRYATRIDAIEQDELDEEIAQQANQERMDRFEQHQRLMETQQDMEEVGRASYLNPHLTNNYYQSSFQFDEAYYQDDEAERANADESEYIFDHDEEEDENNDEDHADNNNVNNSRANSARLHITPRTDRERVINLHERMAHAPEDVMCLAVREPNPEWSNTGVTEEMISRIFNKEP